jgi:predicted neutral ceramidase superfamily lipid hydrolase
MAQAKRAGTDEQSRHDRELMELLNELRVALPGIQVLFAFLLTMPFSQRFVDVTKPQRTVYYVAFLSTAVASILLIAPSIIHRILFRESDKEHILQVSNRLAVVGMLFLAVAITSVVFVISDFLYGSPLSIIVTILIGALALGIWYALPLTRRLS